MTATFQVGQILQGQEKFDEAIAAWKGYLAKFPNGPQSADAQRAILDTQLLIAADHLRREQYAEARAAWQAFVAAEPARRPRARRSSSRSARASSTEKKYDEAIAAWEPLLGKFPGSEPAAHAQFLIASIFETEKGDPAGGDRAVQEGRRRALAVAGAAADRRDGVEGADGRHPARLPLGRDGPPQDHAPGTSRSSPSPPTSSTPRPTSARSTRSAASSRSTSAWSPPTPSGRSTVPGYAKYKPVETTYDLKKLERAGRLRRQGHRREDAPGHDAGPRQRPRRDRQGLARAGARLRPGHEDRQGPARGAGAGRRRRGRSILEAKTGADGVLLTTGTSRATPNAALHVPGLDGADVAGSGLGVPGKVAQGLTPRAYLYTDRPAYRPGQEVALRGVVREVEDGQYANVPRRVYRLEVTDSRGRQLVARPVTLSEFGTFHETLPLDEAAPVGTYRVRLYQPGKSDFAGAVRGPGVPAREDRPGVRPAADRLLPRRDDRGRRRRPYQYGTPLAGRPIDVPLPDGRIAPAARPTPRASSTSSSPTEGFAEEQALRLVGPAAAGQRRGRGRVMLAVRALPDRPATRPATSTSTASRSALEATTLDAQGEPTGQDADASPCSSGSTQAGRITEREVGARHV